MEMRFIDTHCDTMGECIARSEGKVTLQNNPGHINMEKLIRGGDGEAAAAYACLFSFRLTPSQYFSLSRRERAFLLAALAVHAERET